LLLEADRFLVPTALPTLLLLAATPSVFFAALLERLLLLPTLPLVVVVLLLLLLLLLSPPSAVLAESPPALALTALVFLAEGLGAFGTAALATLPGVPARRLALRLLEVVLVLRALPLVLPLVPPAAVLVVDAAFEPLLPDDASGGFFTASFVSLAGACCCLLSCDLASVGSGVASVAFVAAAVLFRLLLGLPLGLLLLLDLLLALPLGLAVLSSSAVSSSSVTAALPALSFFSSSSSSAKSFSSASLTLLSTAAAFTLLSTTAALTGDGPAVVLLSTVGGGVALRGGGVALRRALLSPPSPSCSWRWRLLILRPPLCVW
jgi:hypothetical protein